MKKYAWHICCLFSLCLAFFACNQPPERTVVVQRETLKPQKGLPLCPPLINENRPARVIGLLADVSDLDINEGYYKIPEINSEKGALKVNLHTYYQEYNVGPDVVWLRTYDAEEGEDVDVPLGPTIRVQKDDRLTVILHNDLPLNENWNYLFILEDSEENRSLLTNDSREALLACLNAANAKEVTRRSDSPTGMIDIQSYEDMTVSRDTLDTNMWRIEANDSAMIVKRKRNWAKGHTDLFVYLEFYPANSNVAHDFNNSNLHFHGSHVSPFQDDVLRNVPPTFSSYYTYDLENHQAGTFWYHPHVHGSTSMQVASGMGGVIIVEEDNLQKYPELAAASKPELEKVMVFDQIQYDTINGELTDFEMLTLMGGNNGLQISGAQGTTVNGKIKPKVSIEAGSVARWRLLHKGFYTTLALRFPDEVEVYQIAVDGIMFDEPRAITSLHMAPGNRSDILVKIPKGTPEGDYGIKSITYVSDCEYFPADTSCLLEPPVDAESMLSVTVAGERPNAMRIPKRLPTRAPELQENIAEDQITFTRNTVFNISGGEYLVNDKPFDGNRIDNRPLLETYEEWNVSTVLASHPYHIHINPFQVWSFGGRDLETPMWKDIVYVEPPADDAEAGDLGQNAIIRTHYHKYWGDFVMHCHVLDHEDQGMMQRVTIVREAKYSDQGIDVEPVEEVSVVAK